MCLIPNKILHISGNYESTQMADHILEMGWLGLNYVIFWMQQTT